MQHPEKLEVWIRPVFRDIWVYRENLKELDYPDQRDPRK